MQVEYPDSGHMLSSTIGLWTPCRNVETFLNNCRSRAKARREANTDTTWDIFGREKARGTNIWIAWHVFCWMGQSAAEPRHRSWCCLFELRSHKSPMWKFERFGRKSDMATWRPDLGSTKHFAASQYLWRLEDPKDIKKPHTCFGQPLLIMAGEVVVFGRHNVSNFLFLERRGRHIGIIGKLEQGGSWTEDSHRYLVAPFVAAQPDNMHANIWKTWRQEWQCQLLTRRKHSGSLSWVENRKSRNPWE